jgi:hypothetical protein
MVMDMPDSGRWDGRTYYGRPQLKPPPFNNWLVGSYVFLAGLSGAAQLLSTVIDLCCGRKAEGHRSSSGCDGRPGKLNGKASATGRPSRRAGGRKQRGRVARKKTTG